MVPSTSKPKQINPYLYVFFQAMKNRSDISLAKVKKKKDISSRFLCYKIIFKNEKPKAANHSVWENRIGIVQLIENNCASAT